MCDAGRYDLTDGQPVTTTLAIAEGTENQHEAVIKLVRKYRGDLEEFGFLGFQIQEKRGTQGAATEYATLNEQQSTLLLPYMRNSDIVRQFKKAPKPVCFTPEQATFYLSAWCRLAPCVAR